MGAQYFLEIYRRAHGNYPKTLSDLSLAPPHDYVTGKPLHYLGRPDSSMLLASHDWDQTGNPNTFRGRLELP